MVSSFAMIEQPKFDQLRDLVKITILCVFVYNLHGTASMLNDPPAEYVKLYVAQNPPSLRNMDMLASLD